MYITYIWKYITYMEYIIYTYILYTLYITYMEKCTAPNAEKMLEKFAGKMYIS